MAESPKGILRQRLNNSTCNSTAKDDAETSLEKQVLEDNSAESQMKTSSSFLPEDGSLISGDVERWIHGWESSSPVSTGVQKSRLTVVQRSTYTNEIGSAGSRFFYTLTALIPLIRTHQRALWNCSTSALMNSLDPLFVQIEQICNRMHGQFLRFTTDQVIQEVFTTALDMILFIYAIGFLFISFYQLSITT